MKAKYSSKNGSLISSQKTEAATAAWEAQTEELRTTILDLQAKIER